jgi:hypothetical protein
MIRFGFGKLSHQRTGMFIFPVKGLISIEQKKQLPAIPHRGSTAKRKLLIPAGEHYLIMCSFLLILIPHGKNAFPVFKTYPESSSG